MSEKTISELLESLKNIKEITRLNISKDEVLVVHIPEDKFNHDMGENIRLLFKLLGFERVVTDNVGVKFSAIKKEPLNE